MGGTFESAADQAGVTGGAQGAGSAAASAANAKGAARAANAVKAATGHAGASADASAASSAAGSRAGRPSTDGGLAHGGVFGGGADSPADRAREWRIHEIAARLDTHRDTAPADAAASKTGPSTVGTSKTGGATAGAQDGGKGDKAGDVKDGDAARDGRPSPLRPQGATVDERIRSLMRDPRYWRDRDPDLQAHVARQWQRAYPGRRVHAGFKAPQPEAVIRPEDVEGWPLGGAEPAPTPRDGAAGAAADGPTQVAMHLRKRDGAPLPFGMLHPDSESAAIRRESADRAVDAVRDWIDGLVDPIDPSTRRPTTPDASGRTQIVDPDAVPGSPPGMTDTAADVDARSGGAAGGRGGGRLIFPDGRMERFDTPPSEASGPDDAGTTEAFPDDSDVLPQGTILEVRRKPGRRPVRVDVSGASKKATRNFVSAEENGVPEGREGEAHAELVDGGKLTTDKDADANTVNIDRDGGHAAAERAIRKYAITVGAQLDETRDEQLRVVTPSGTTVMLTPSTSTGQPTVIEQILGPTGSRKVREGSIHFKVRFHDR